MAMALPLAHMVAHVSDLGYDYETGAQLLALMLATAGVSAFFGVGFFGKTVWRPENNFYFFGCPRFVFIRTHFRGSSLDDLPCRNILRLGLRWSSSLLPCNSERVLAGLPGRRRTALVILCASGRMALGSWIGGALYDVTGSYSLAFIIGVGFNIFNLVIIGHLIHRNTRQKKAVL